jgi:hypothetical protein
MKRLEYYVKLMSKNSISEYGFFPISDHGSGSWMQGSEKHWIPDPDPQHLQIGCVTKIMKKECACQDQEEEEEEGGMDLYSSRVQAV